MTLLPQVERALVKAAGQQRGGRVPRMVPRLAPVLAMAAVVASVGVFIATRPADVEREAASPPPPAAARDLETLASAARCTLTHPPVVDGDGEHAAREFTASDYRSNPPTSGAHSPEAAADGIYEQGETPSLGRLVHALEHGRINVEYKPGIPVRDVAELRSFVAENDGYHMLLFQNETGMEEQVAATAWGHSLTCDGTGPEVVRALRAFRDRYVDKGPERVP